MSVGRIFLAGLGDDKPDLRRQVIVKNDAIQQQINDLLGKNSLTAATSEDSLKSFLDSFSRTAPLVRSQITSGIGAVGDIYSGRFETDLSNLRGSRATAREAATAKALALARGRDRAYSASLGLPGRSSYRDLMESRIMGDTLTAAGLEGEDMKRSDYMTVLAQKLGNLGTGAGALQTLGGVESMPATMSTALRSLPLETLTRLTNLDQLNNWYNLYKERGTLERWAQGEDEWLNSVGQAASIAGMFMGGGGGAGAGGGGGGGGGGGAMQFLGGLGKSGGGGGLQDTGRPYAGSGNLWNQTPYYNPAPLTGY